MTIGNLGKLVVNNLDDFARFAKKADKVDDVANIFLKKADKVDDFVSSLKKSKVCKELNLNYLPEKKSFISKLKELFKGKSPKVHYMPGEIARAQKPGKIKINSVPTQQYIDDMLDVAKTDRINQVTKDGVGWVNKKAVQDAHYAFTKGTPIQQVKTTSTPTKQVIEDMFDFKTADAYASAEAFGTEMPKKILDKRKDCQAVWGGAYKTLNTDHLKLPKLNAEQLKLAKSKSVLRKIYEKLKP